MTEGAPLTNAIVLAVDVTNDQRIADEFVARLAPRATTPLGINQWSTQRDSQCISSVALLVRPGLTNEPELVEALEEALDDADPEERTIFKRLVAFEGSGRLRWLKRNLGVRRGLSQFSLNEVDTDDWWAIETGSSMVVAEALRREQLGIRSRKTMAIGHALMLFATDSPSISGRATEVGDEIGRSLDADYGSTIAFLKEKAQKADFSTLSDDIAAELAQLRGDGAWRGVSDKASASLGLTSTTWARHANRLSFNLLEAAYLSYITARASDIFGSGA